MAYTSVERSVGEKKMQADDVREKSRSATPIAKVVELIGNSEKSVEDAVERALAEASHSIKHITGVEIIRTSAIVNHNKVAEWRVDMRIAFGVEHNRRGASP